MNETSKKARGAAAWPAWLGPAAFALALLTTGLLVSTMTAVLSGAFGISRSAPGVTIAGTVVQDAMFLAAACVLAWRFGPIRGREFGLRRLAPVPLLRATAVAGIAFLAFSIAYGLALSPEGQQDTLETLGADRSSVLLVLSGLLVVGLAPFAEEIFFRGFFYRALRNRFRVGSAVAMNAALFGAIHFDGRDTLVLLPLLAVLGAVFCLLYERTGSLYPSIALHAINNALAFGASDSGSPALAIGLGALVVALCLVLASRAAPADDTSRAAASALRSG